jgi:hypothetical protein
VVAPLLISEACRGAYKAEVVSTVEGEYVFGTGSALGAVLGFFVLTHRYVCLFIIVIGMSMGLKSQKD